MAVQRALIRGLRRLRVRCGPVGLLLPAFLLASALLAAAKPLPAMDPRVLGMGGAAVAMVRGSEGVSYNPSALVGAPFQVSFAGSWAPSTSDAHLPALLQRLQAALDGQGPLPDTDARVSGFAAVATHSSAVALWAEASTRSSGSQRRGELRSALAFATGRSFRLRHMEAAWGTAVKLRYDRWAVEPGSGASSGNPGSGQDRGQSQGFSVDLGWRLQPKPWLTLAAALYDVAGTVLMRSFSNPASDGTDQWLAAPRGWAAGLAVAPPGAPLRAAVEVRAGGGWSAGVEQELFGGAAVVRLGRLVEGGGQAFNTVGLGLRIEPLAVDLAAGLGEAGQPPVISGRLGLSF